MEIKEHGPVSCQICKKEKRPDELLPGSIVRKSVVETIRKVYPEWSPDGFICLSDLDYFRTEHIQDVLELEKGELSELDKEVVKSLRQQELLSQNLNSQFEKSEPIGNVIADKVAEFGGSWRFIISFGVIIFVWITFNSALIFFKSFDPFPFILLNLVLSCLAALQAPVIMMSQNRQEAKDRMRAENDYKTNLKAELEIRQMHEKIDHLLTHQWMRLMETQQIQMELIEEISRKVSKVNEGE